VLPPSVVTSTGPARNIQFIDRLAATEIVRDTAPLSIGVALTDRPQVTLEELAPKEKRAGTVAGDRAVLKVEGSRLVVQNSRGEYLGRVEPKHAPRLIRLMLGGNKYSAVVVKSTADGMTVMVRETYQDPSQVGKLSFPPKGKEEFRAYGSDKLTKIEGKEEEEEPGYTIIGGDEIEVMPEEVEEVEDDTGNEDE